MKFDRNYTKHLIRGYYSIMWVLPGSKTTLKILSSKPTLDTYCYMLQESEIWKDNFRGHIITLELHCRLVSLFDLLIT